jgi:N-methylhydantoinase B
MPPPVDPITAEVFRHQTGSIAEEMGLTLERTAYSPNIKERRDHSCALFDADGRLIAQAAHIPVHLGAFPQMMQRLAGDVRWSAGDVLICNDPAVGGTHLPDISLVTPVFHRGRLAGFVANRAHHADIGGAYPGSMAPTTELYQEGLILPPVKLVERGRTNHALVDTICRNVRTPDERRGDLAAQLAANATGQRRLSELLDRYGARTFRRLVADAFRRTREAAASLLAKVPLGAHVFTDYLDDDGFGSAPLPIRVTLTVRDRRLIADFTGTAPQQKGSVNAPLAVTHSAVYYSLVCLLPPDVHINSGAFDVVTVAAPEGTLVNAAPPAAVAAGNVETSQRIVDVVLGALAQALPGRVPAASQGTMNNLAIGGTDPRTQRPWTYYETTGGGIGAAVGYDGISGVHCHMSNTRNTPAEALEYHYPLRLRRYELRTGSGGPGVHAGGDGIFRELELLGPARAALLTDRRHHSPYGVNGGDPGLPGRNWLRSAECERELDTKTTVELLSGDRLVIATPGGGGWGTPEG